MSKCQKCCTAITVLFTAAGLITVLIIGTLVYPLEIRNALLKLTTNSNTISNSTNVINENDTIVENNDDDHENSEVEHTTWYVPADPEKSHEHVKIHKGNNANSSEIRGLCLMKGTGKTFFKFQNDTKKSHIIFFFADSKSEDGGQTWITKKEIEEYESKENQEKDVDLNQTENPKKRESSSQEKQENENWGDQLTNNNFGPDQDYNDNDLNKNDDAVEIMNTIDQNDLGPNHLLL